MSLLLFGCIIAVLLAVVAGAVVLFIISKQGQGVSDARQGWIEGTSFKDDSSD